MICIECHMKHNVDKKKIRCSNGRTGKYMTPGIPSSPILCRKRKSYVTGTTCPAIKDSLESASVAPGESIAVEIKTQTSLWDGYCEQLQDYPARTKAFTSFVGFALGDLLAQFFEGSSFDAARMARIASYGLLLDGPVGHLWYRWLDGSCDSFFKNPRGTSAIAVKTAADQVIWAPAMTMVFFAFLKVAEGDPNMVWPTIQEKLVGTVAANYAIWPLAHVISFKYIPSSQRILYNNVIAIFWNCYLSAVAADTASSLVNMQALDPSTMDVNSIHAIQTSAMDSHGNWTQGLHQWLQELTAWSSTGSSVPCQIDSLQEVAERVQDSLNLNRPIQHVLQASAESALVSSKHDGAASLPFLEALVQLQKQLVPQ